MRDLLSQAFTYGRFLSGFPAFLRRPLTAEQARAAVQDRLAHRQENLLATAEKLVFGLPTSPYRSLLELAGCSLSDFRAMVRDRGVEGTLIALREAGVYFSFEEYKGREPVVRAGREIPLQTWQFDNPLLANYYSDSSGGTTGPPSRAAADLSHLERQAELRLLALEAHGVLDDPYAIWRPALPSGTGLKHLMWRAKVGKPVRRWFTPMVPGQYRTALKYRLATAAAIAVGRACGARLVRPEPVALDDALVIAHYLTQTVAEHGRACLNTTVSCGLRVAVAAGEAGLRLDGVTLVVAGEPTTPAKVRGIEASGARFLCDYGTVETGRIGFRCANPSRYDDMHVATDSVGMILFPRTVPQSGETVHSIHVTSLLTSMPKIMLNLELDDFGEMYERDCGCPLGKLGLRSHLRGVRSFRKLVGEGVTLIGSDMVRILEEVLPERVGGSPLDYQLVEEEDERGFTRLSLVIDPRIEVDESKAISTMLEALRQTSVAADMARAHWDAAGSFRVVRRPPDVSVRGKQMHLRLASSGGL